LRLAAVAQSIEYRDAIFAADHDFAVDQAGTASKSLYGGGNGWIAPSLIDPASSQKPHASAITSRQHAKAVQLDLVNPAVASRRVRGWAGEARFDEAS
jgi:hypothetical protein